MFRVLLTFVRLRVEYTAPEPGNFFSLPCIILTVE